ncbi:MFS transporter [Mesorhizobium sp. B2-7-3]|uniref:Arabinose efflux permease family protein n=1 Tax=Mesorhizobium australicum (strain HAMBI 3006 / LMG 24608 / WSM2073) TaxID=754035 RepID=L0KGI1_MESAW|nr:MULTISPECIES: MFS transporter [Mesorhizobium]AGB44437.1 arabinose efflux permease family protein [Mesorhizobium australicum WSM2073]MBZ9680513.1 MFS transporter [Mesorhizobium sp. CO1-1-2]MBZ9926339.1 MFS transporter [Mesorhizobium sp. BR1-1-4]TPJ17514.1 MFS transporter [Mesorhizobium sp. B2-7-3]TPK77667.1 MFS transporter [Mesorhizobium sp. B2-4-18]
MIDEKPDSESVSALAPFRHGIFRAVWGASLVSNFGGLIQGVGAAWMMTTIATSPYQVALVQASTTLPIMLFALVAGAIADSFDRRKVMLVAQTFMLVVSVLLTAFTYLDLITPWTLLAFTFLIDSGTALNSPSWQASVGDIVPRNKVPAAVALNSMGFNLTRSVGPAIGGIIVAAAGAAAAFAANAVSYVGLIVVLARWKPDLPASTLPRESLGAAMGAGLRYVAMSPNIGKVLVRGAAFGFSAGAVLALLPLVARDVVKGDALTYGIMLGAFGIGAVGGALISVRLRQLLSSETMVRCAFAGFAACAFNAAVSQHAWQTSLGLLVGGACWVIALSHFNVTVQMATPRWVVGRVLSVYQTATFGGIALGSWIWGVVADAHGAETALIAAAIAMLAGGAIGLVLPLPQQQVLNLDPLNRFKEPHLALDLKPRSGPIAIMIEYIIRHEDEAEFLATMAERGRIRRRDGARNWTLARDLENPSIWIEHYHTPTWLEYVRHNGRITQADAMVGERLRALHSGNEPPRVRRVIERPTTAGTALVMAKGPIEH